MKTIDEFLEELKEFIRLNTYRDYYRDKVVDPEKITEEIEEFQAELKQVDDDQSK